MRQDKQDTILLLLQQEMIRVDDDGRVFNQHGREYRGRHPGGYISAAIGLGGRGNHIVAYAHQVTWLAKHGAIPCGLEINHINGIKTDNRPLNLELVTRGENLRHARRTGLNPVGERHYAAKLSNAQVCEIRRRAAGAPRGIQQQLCREFGVSSGLMSRICRDMSRCHG